MVVARLRLQPSLHTAGNQALAGDLWWENAAGEEMTPFMLVICFPVPASPESYPRRGGTNVSYRSGVCGRCGPELSPAAYAPAIQHRARKL